MNKVVKKSGLSLLAFMMLMSNFNVVVKAIEEPKASKVGMPLINPTPKKITNLGDGFTISDSVNLVGEASADQDAVVALKTLLTTYGIRVNATPLAGSTTIIIGEVDDQLVEADALQKQLSIEDASGLNKEGYVLATKKTDDTRDILIEGKEGVGTFYGVQTLRQMLQKQNDEIKTPEVVIRDEPDMKDRGIVEGFYGTPWSHEARLDQMHFYGQNKMNLYIYAPKDDPYHRDKWREPYPTSEMERMKDLIDTSKENKVNFVFAISPGNDIRFDGVEGEEDIQALIHKAEAMYDMGVRSYAIYFDDIADRSGDKQANVLNRFHTDFVQKKGDVTPLITVPTEYFSSGMMQEGNKSPYTKAFSETLNEGIEVMWTGQEVVSQGVSKEDAQKVFGIFERKMDLWWNYPVTDYNTKKLALGPIYNVSTDIKDEVSMFAVNPMEFAQTSKISIGTGADYAWNLEAYDADASWKKNIQALYGANAEDFTYFANHSTRVDNGRADAPEMQARIDQLWKNLEAGKDIREDAQYLRGEFTKMKEVSARLLENLPPEILSETSLQLKQFAIDADYAEEALRMLETFLAGDMASWWEIKHMSELHMEESKKAPAQVSSVVKNFIAKSHEEGNKLFDKQIPKDEVETIHYTGSASMESLNYAKWWYTTKPYEPQNFAIDNQDYAYRSKDNVTKDSWIQIDLGETKHITNLYLLQGKTQVDNSVRGQFSYSMDGQSWTKIKGEYQDYETILTKLDIDARYIRFTASNDEEFQYFVRDFKVNKDINAEELTSSVHHVKSSIKRAIEGSDKFVPTIEATIEDTKVKKDDTFTLTLRDDTYIKDVQATFGVDGVLEYTRNDVDWIEATKENLSSHPFVTRVRFRATQDGTIKTSTLKVTTEERNPGTITTNYNFRTDGGNIADLNDYDLGSNCTDTSTKAGQWMQLDLGEITHIRDISMIFNEAYSGDRPNDVTFSYSKDGKEWTQLPFNVYSWNNHFTNLNIDARYVKMVNNTDRGGTWTRIGEFSVNAPTPEIHFETSVNGIQPTNRVTNLTDGNLASTYVPETGVKQGDSVIYHLDKQRDLKRLHILQKADKLSNAKVIARTIDKKEIVLGTLDKGYTILDMPSRMDVESIKIEFTSAQEIELNEVAFEYYTLQAIKDEAVATIEKANKLLDADKSKASKARLQQAMDAVSMQLEKEDKVALTNALDQLIIEISIYEQSINKDGLETLIQEAKLIHPSLYTKASYQTLMDALNVAQAVFNNTDATQSQVDQANASLAQAIRLLVKVPDTEDNGNNNNGNNNGNGGDKPNNNHYSVQNQDGTIRISGLLSDGVQLISNILDRATIDQILAGIKDEKSLAFLQGVHVESLYELKLMKDHVEYIPSEGVNVSFTLQEAWKDKKLGIIYLNEAGILEELPSEIIGDSIVFKTDKNGTYGVVSYKDGKPNNGPDTSDSSNSRLAMFLLVGSGIIILILKRKKEA